MSRFPTGSIALAVCMAYGVSVMAQSLPKSQTFPRDGNEMPRARAAAEYEWNKARCNALADQARTACLAAAQSRAQTIPAPVRRGSARSLRG